MENWKIVTKDGNPDKEGIYDAILIHEDLQLVNPDALTEDEQYEKTGKVFAVRDSRWFGPVSKDRSWVMKDQPEEGLVWYEECGSYTNEYVYAWLPARHYPEIELPEGVEWEG